MRSETSDAVRGIWDDAKPLVEKFLVDLKGLRVIENDVEEFKVFLNKSYHANEFYIKDVVNITMMMFDELALKSHFESLPAIVSEIWEIMGESGTKIKKSILWVIEKVSLSVYIHFIPGIVTLKWWTGFNRLILLCSSYCCDYYRDC